MIGSNRVCRQLGVEPVEPGSGSKLGIALETLGLHPINGLRHTPTEETNGWYVWCGTNYSSDDDFFSPLHVEHVSAYLPQIEDYLNLPPGYRFMIDKSGLEDTWFDPNLLKDS